MKRPRSRSRASVAAAAAEKEQEPEEAAGGSAPPGGSDSDAPREVADGDERVERLRERAGRAGPRGPGSGGKGRSRRERELRTNWRQFFLSRFCTGGAAELGLKLVFSGGLEAEMEGLGVRG
ncbi:hypothetical protein JRQ81_008272 [Phrynocephalus forsythii]|uniref:Uncharacterized protein n=1 Tax=Phrynocephalus forsythii TaxID=171643 RepID=A0A9Q0XDM1_9SAUR|nr:hypothetical protein JRQ81_008272 [Phrynocephalus forsythii]